MNINRMSGFACILLGIWLLVASALSVHGQEPVLARKEVCHFYGEARQGDQAWNKDESCTIPRLEYLDTSYRQGDFVCCGGSAQSATTNRDIPPGLEVVVTGGYNWSVGNLNLRGNQFFLHTYCAPDQWPGPGCNVKVDVWAHYRVIPQPSLSNQGVSTAGVATRTKNEANKNKSGDRLGNPVAGFGNWDKILAFGFGFFFTVILLLIAKFDREPTPLGILIYRVVLALVASGIGAVIPGMVDVNVQPLVRAGGAIGLFVIVFLFNPPNLVTNAPKGPQPNAKNPNT